MVVVLYHWGPTREERELAQYYTMPVVASVLTPAWLSIRRAQSMADDAYQELFLRKPVTTTTFNTSNDDEDGAPSTRRERRRRRDLRRSSQYFYDYSYDNNPPDKHHHHHHNNKNEPKDLFPGCETTVMLIRHCEKGTVTEHCAVSGFERSVYLSHLFGSRWPKPVGIFAQSPRGRQNRHKMNFREIETVGPLAASANLTVDDSYDDETLNDLAKYITRTIQDGKLCGQLIVVSWKHSRIPHLARHLGCGPKQGCPLEYPGQSFDQVWEIKFVYDTMHHSHHKHEFVVSVQQQTPTWGIYGSIQYENFDPLAVSYAFGDYPPGGIILRGEEAISNHHNKKKKNDGQQQQQQQQLPISQHWKSFQYSYPERVDDSDTAGWREQRVGIPLHRPSQQDKEEDDQSKPKQKSTATQNQESVIANP
jgi:hypothetical protein